VSSSDTLPVTTPGHLPTAADWGAVASLLGASGPDGGLLSARPPFKTTATTYAASSTTMQSDPDLTAALAANATYRFEVVAFVTSNSAAQWKHGFAVPSGSSFTWQAVALDSSVTAAGSGIVDRLGRSSSTPTVGVDSTTQVAIWIAGGIITTTAGTLAYQGAQATSNATAPIVGARSHMIVTRLS